MYAIRSYYVQVAFRVGESAGDQRQIIQRQRLSAILPYTRRMIFLEDGDFARLTVDGFEVVDAEGRRLESYNFV